MYGCENWTVKKAEHRRIDTFELWCWRRLESPLDCREVQPVHPKGDQSWVFIGKTDAEAEIQYFGHLMQRTDSLEKILTLGKIEGRRRTTEDGMVGWPSPMQWTWVWVNSRSRWWTRLPAVLQSMGSQSQTQLSDWTDLLENSPLLLSFCFFYMLWYFFPCEFWNQSRAQI